MDLYNAINSSDRKKYLSFESIHDRAAWVKTGGAGSEADAHTKFTSDA